MEIVRIYATFPKAEDANKTVSQLLEDKLIACANIFDVSSHYHWEGAETSENEVGVFMKTSISKSKKALMSIEKAHPYEVPLIAHEKIVVNAAYGEWLEDQLSDS